MININKIIKKEPASERTSNYTTRFWFTPKDLQKLNKICKDFGVSKTKLCQDVITAMICDYAPAPAVAAKKTVVKKKPAAKKKDNGNGTEVK